MENNNFMQQNNDSHKRPKHLDILRDIKSIYDQGSNIIKFLNEYDQSNINSDEAILIAYEFQAGTYAENYYKNESHFLKFAAQISDAVQKLENSNNKRYDTLLEVGVGEATTLKTVLSNLGKQQENCYGFDQSWSRLKSASYFLHKFSKDNVNLFTGNLFQTPLMDNSVDIVYTANSVEPNGGREEEALRELYRITKRYLLLIEPSYELADEHMKARMKEHGYVQNLYATAKSLGYHVLEHKLLDISHNPQNPVAIMIIEKNTEETEEKNSDILCCPITRRPLKKHDNVMFAEESYLMYPVIQNIPCLLPENAIMGYKFR